jgi:ornithine carbamoyltransferase
MGSLQGRDYLGVRDLSPDELQHVVDLAAELKARLRDGGHPPLLRGKILALVFEKPSLRTRATFETGMWQLGGHAVYLGPQDIQMGTRESPADVAKNLQRWVHGIAARTFEQATVDTLARNSGVPVINALSDWEHPLQTLAALQTIQERFGRLSGRRVAWVGDGNNVLRSLVYAGARLGLSLVIATPEEYGLDSGTLAWGRAVAGSSLDVTDDPVAAVRDADLIYTDVWTSMGQESTAAARRRLFQPYQVNAALLAHAPAHALVSHCLPAHRGEEITDEVLDGPRSIAFDEAENRLHVQKALLADVL